MHVLLDMDLTENDKEHVKGTLRYMIQNRFPSGNYPCTEGDNYDCLVHWCHGAPGVSLTLAKASQVSFLILNELKPLLCAAACYSLRYGAFILKAFVLRCSQKSNFWRQRQMQLRSFGIRGFSKELGYVME
jgi:hypothetical protein